MLRYILPAMVLGLASTAVAAESSGGGLPQFDSSTFASQLFWLAVTFTALYIVCARIFLPRLSGVIEGRRSRIANDFDKAAEDRAKAESAEKALRKALADARARAGQIAAQTRAETEAEIAALQAETDQRLEADIAGAEARIKATTAAATLTIREAARETTRTIVAALIDETPSDDAVDAALARVVA